jgi:hypothetical protein
MQLLDLTFSVLYFQNRKVGNTYFSCFEGCGMSSIVVTIFISPKLIYLNYGKEDLEQIDNVCVIGVRI